MAIFQNYKYCQDTMIQNKQQLSGFHYSEKSNDKKKHWLGNFQNYKYCQDTMIQNKQQLSGFHYSEKSNDKK